MTAMETMVSAKATRVAATTATNQDQWAACCTQWLVLSTADIVRLCERGSGGTKQAQKHRQGRM
jgi:hypothetical protein